MQSRKLSARLTWIGDDGAKRSRCPLASTEDDMRSTRRADGTAVDIIVDNRESVRATM